MIASTLNKPQAVQIVQTLLQHGANPRLKNKDGWTAMHLACKAGNMDLVSQLALAEPKLIMYPSRNGRIPLHIAALNRHSELASHLIGLGGPEMCNTRDACGSTPAMDAVSSGSLQTLEAICCHVDLSSQVDKWGLTCLHKAAQLGHTQLVQYLVQAGLQVNAQTPSEGYTALHYAVAEKQSDTVLKLLQLGADLILCNKYNQTGTLTS
ncbi:hypothetical protein B566_EDAN008317 [Ephemera danica]|nr:hypothetical protein B566_EDAN008317 [Ephemera danica]